MRRGVGDAREALLVVSRWKSRLPTIYPRAAIPPRRAFMGEFEKWPICGLS
jgi:hypothetical protein